MRVRRSVSSLYTSCAHIPVLRNDEEGCCYFRRTLTCFESQPAAQPANIAISHCRSALFSRLSRIAGWPGIRSLAAFLCWRIELVHSSKCLEYHTSITLTHIFDDWSPGVHAAPWRSPITWRCTNKQGGAAESECNRR